MEAWDLLALHHRRVVDECIRVVLDEVACDMGDLERNVLGWRFARRWRPGSSPGCSPSTPSFWGLTRRTWRGFRRGWTGSRLRCLRTLSFSR